MHCLFLDCNHFVVKQGEEGSSAVDLETASFIRGKRDSEQQTAEGTAGTATLEKYHENKHKQAFCARLEGAISQSTKKTPGKQLVGLEKSDK